MNHIWSDKLKNLKAFLRMTSNAELAHRLAVKDVNVRRWVKMENIPNKRHQRIIMEFWNNINKD